MLIWNCNTRLEKIMGDFWVIVIDVLQEPCAFVMKPSEVKDMVHRGEKDGKVSYWLNPSVYDKDDFREKWDRIGHGDDVIHDREFEAEKNDNKS